jgi:hypothetical protein
MAYDAAAQDRLNESHVAFPQPGDYWHEMFCPYHVVLAFDGTNVIVCEKKVDVDKDHWTFDLSETKTYPLDQFRKKVTYGSIAGFVADVMPQSKLMPMVNEWRAAKRAEIQKQMDFYKD